MISSQILKKRKYLFNCMMRFSFIVNPRRLEFFAFRLRSQSKAGEIQKWFEFPVQSIFRWYPLTEDMKLPDLIRAAGGLKDSAYLLDAEITRIGLSKDQKAFVEHVRLNNLSYPRPANRCLSCFDLTIRSRLNRYPFGRGETVEILGEVNFPGPIHESR